MPVNVLLTRALMQYHLYYGDKFMIECPTGSGNTMNLFEVAARLSIGWPVSFVRSKCVAADNRRRREIPKRSLLA